MPTAQTEHSGHQRRLWFLTVAGGVAILGAAFLMVLRLGLDATSLANTESDPASGRVRGAYTVVESWLGFHRPSLLVRAGELAVAIAIMSAALYRVTKRFAGLRAG